MQKKALDVLAGPKHVAQMGQMEHRIYDEFVVQTAVGMTENQFHRYIATLPAVVDSLPVNLAAKTYPITVCLRPAFKK